MNVVLIGSGNVATVFGRLIKSSSHTVAEVVSRDEAHAQTLATELNANAQTSINAVTKNAGIYIICVADNAIETVSTQLRLENKIVVHTSGAISKNVLRNASRRFGVLYPLQSLRKESVHVPAIPLLIDGNTKETIQAIQTFAKSLSNNVHHSSDEERLKLHVTAVFVSNFTNHLYALAEEYCKKERIDFSLLVQLIKEVAERVEIYDPIEMQTGPAFRDDVITIQKHLQLLNDHLELKNIYAVITESIQKFYQTKRKNKNPH
jgi:predicted short-subunit dehydrogenase-like oxidoreductase (DUF2520 family)